MVFKLIEALKWYCDEKRIHLPGHKKGYAVVL